MQEEPTGKYAPGEIVFAKENPNEELRVRRYTRRIYYCQFPNNPDRKEVVLFEREIVDKK